MNKDELEELSKEDLVDIILFLSEEVVESELHDLVRFQIDVLTVLGRADPGSVNKFIEEYRKRYEPS